MVGYKLSDEHRKKFLAWRDSLPISARDEPKLFIAANYAAPRDEFILFDEKPHKYYVWDPEIEGPMENPISVTTIIHSMFEPFDADKVLKEHYEKWQSMKDPRYYGMSREAIKAKWKANSLTAEAGTEMHRQIEYYLNRNQEPSELVSAGTANENSSFFKLIDAPDSFTTHRKYADRDAPLDASSTSSEIDCERKVKKLKFESSSTPVKTIGPIIIIDELKTESKCANEENRVKQPHEKLLLAAPSEVDSWVSCRHSPAILDSYNYYFNHQDSKDCKDCKTGSLEEEEKIESDSKLPSFLSRISTFPVVNAPPEWNYFLKFDREKIQANGWLPYRTEWRIWCGKLGIVGSIDLICLRSKMDPTKIIIVDWKRSKEIKQDSPSRGTGPLKGLSGGNFVHYSLQLNLYRYILERHYGFTVVGMFLAIFHPDAKDYQMLPVSPDYFKFVDKILQHRQLTWKSAANPAYSAHIASKSSSTSSTSTVHH